MQLLLRSGTAISRFQARRWQLYAGWKTGVRSKPGRLESLPRTAAIKQNCTRKKAMQYLMWRAVACSLIGFPGPAAGFAATEKRLATALPTQQPPELVGKVRSNVGPLPQILVGCQAAIASKPAPTIGPEYNWESQVGYQAASRASFAPTGPTQTSLMGVHPPRKNQAGCQAAIASRLAPTRVSVVYKINGHHRSLWEPSLLAIAMGLLASMLNVPPPSRASPLPQLDRSTTGRARSATRPPREQALLPQILLKQV